MSRGIGYRIMEEGDRGSWSVSDTLGPMCEGGATARGERGQRSGTVQPGNTRVVLSAWTGRVLDMGA